ncbi:hypothetical protein DASC09_021740 [Saccharomycopsis crataegensis]|uniref:Uncharacterized protein n=1 Tax=Saccharomycopsis crataegensis TaxID=43959 RepID=A0AAV5QJQ6_9ASCO|nr:hypothetical protein DASC09_021740 [Saccharomycopsis crataegensis]
MLSNGKLIYWKSKKSAANIIFSKLISQRSTYLSAPETMTKSYCNANERRFFTTLEGKYDSISSNDNTKDMIFKNF